VAAEVIEGTKNYDSQRVLKLVLFMEYQLTITVKVIMLVWSFREMVGCGHFEVGIRSSGKTKLAMNFLIKCVGY
jgi:hypothetical protein